MIGPIRAEDAAHVDQAIDELSDWSLPQVWVGDPNWDEMGNPVGLKSDWLKLVDFFGADLVSRSEQVQLFEEALYVLAARSELVAVKKVLPLDGITTAEQVLIASAKQPSYAMARDSNLSPISPFGSEFRLKDWRGEGTVVLFELPPDKCFPLGSTNFIRCIAKNVVTQSHLPYLDDFFHRALYGPCDDIIIEATDEVVFVANGLKELERIVG